MSDGMLKVLDHGLVRLVDNMGSDLSIVRNARVSYDASWRAGNDRGSDERLINYLYKNKHNTPFESVTMTFEVKAPIFVIRQWHRHRTQSYNELSARYRELPREFYVPEPHLIGKQSSDNKQMRDCQSIEDFNGMPPEYIKSSEDASEVMRNSAERAFNEYDKLLSQGVPRELARTVLPLSTYSHMFITLNLHNLFGFMRERLHPHAQYEIRVYAQAMLNLVEPHYPVSISAFNKYQ